jgi:hypothetical protein
MKLADDTQPEALADNTENVGFLHDQQVFAVDLDFRAGPLAEQNLVASLDVQRNQLASFVTSAGASSDNFAFLRLSLAESGIMIPPAVFASDSTRRTTTRS